MIISNEPIKQLNPVCYLSNLEVLCFVLGWQAVPTSSMGGTLQQVSKTLRIPEDVVLNADHDKMLDLCRMAQSHMRCKLFQQVSQPILEAICGEMKGE